MISPNVALLVCPHAWDRHNTAKKTGSERTRIHLQLQVQFWFRVWRPPRPQRRESALGELNSGSLVGLLV
jgi:hypothetical protein